MGISNALYLTPELLSELESPKQRTSLMNVQVPPKFDAPRLVLTHKTTLTPVENRLSFRAYTGKVVMSRPSIAILISLRNDGYIDVHTIRHRVHTTSDVHGALALAIHMNEATQSQLHHDKHISEGAAHEHVRELKDVFTKGGDVEHAYIIIDASGTYRVGRQDLFIEALYAVACRKENL